MNSVETAPTPSDGSSAARGSFLDVTEVASWLGTSQRHVRRMVAERRIPFVKIGHYVRFDEDDVASWVDEQRVWPSAEGKG